MCSLWMNPIVIQLLVKGLCLSFLFCLFCLVFEGCWRSGCATQTGGQASLPEETKVSEISALLLCRLLFLTPWVGAFMFSWTVQSELKIALCPTSPFVCQSVTYSIVVVESLREKNSASWIIVHTYIYVYVPQSFFPCAWRSLWCSCLSLVVCVAGRRKRCQVFVVRVHVPCLLCHGKAMEPSTLMAKLLPSTLALVRLSKVLCEQI